MRPLRCVCGAKAWECDADCVFEQVRVQWRSGGYDISAASSSALAEYEEAEAEELHHVLEERVHYENQKAN